VSELPPPIAWDHGQRRQALVQSVLADVFNGTLRAGQHLVAQDLADRFGVSQTPIREALITLAGIGVIDLQPNRGAVVRAVTERDVRVVCQVRRVLECEAARAACGRVPPATLEALAADILRLTPDAAGAAAARAVDDRLHDAVAGHCGNALLAREIGGLKLLFRAYRDGSWDSVAERNDFRRIPAEAADHLAIVAALLAGDQKAAARAMAAHIRSGEHYWTRAVFGLHRNGSRDSDHTPISPSRRKGHR
jgi:DNA-binding GntR family transcriptional regulator